MDNGDITQVFKILRESIAPFTTPAVTLVSETTRDPFKVLISCILSLRTQDGTTGAASERLFKLADSPVKMGQLSTTTIEEAIYPVGFYRNKAIVIKDICITLAERYDSIVPDSIDELLTLKGVGRKTANLVVTMGYGKPGICVDTHVHRITNRWGYVETKKPDETEFVLRKLLPKRYWIPINDLLVTFGQNICKPISPFCSKCRLVDYCGKVDVVKSR
ncbi:MAG: endonuclease III [Deltaproteobacteria bacterium]|nr:endonuclease III [Deltaproteobacteria bacterium]